MYSGTAMDWIQAEDGWSTPTFIPTAAWSPATWVAEAPAGVLQREPVPTAAALTFRARGSFRAWPTRSSETTRFCPRYVLMNDE